MRGDTASFLIATAVIARCLAAQTADPLQFLPRGVIANALISDSAGNFYAGGSRNGHGFLAKLSSDRASIEFLYIVDGGGSDVITSLALGPGGDIFASGTTNSGDFPATKATGPRSSQADPRAFVLKLDRDGTLQYATLIGGGSATYGNAIAVNAKGEALVSGQLVDLASPVFSTSPNAVIGNSDPNTGFIVKLDRTGANVLIAIRGFGLGPIAYDVNDNIYVTGSAYGDATIAATPGAFQSSHTLQGCAGTGFVGIACSYQYVAKINADGTKLVYSTFVTGMFGANPAALIVDSAGNALIAGSTNSKDYPVTPGAYQTDYRVTNRPPPSLPTPHPPIIPPPSTGYITKLNASGTALVWSTFFSGTGSETIHDLRLDSENHIIVTGTSGSRDLPGAQSMPAGCTPGFNREVAYIAQLSSDATGVIGGRYVFALSSGSPVRVALSPDGTPVIGASDSLESIDFSAPMPLACTIDPADNARINHIAPGQLLTLFGDDFNIDDLQVWIGGIEAPLLYTSQHQINARVPVELDGYDAVDLAIQTNGALITRPLRIVPRAPSAFLVLQDVNPFNPAVSCKGVIFGPAYQAIARNEDGSLNSCDQPAAQGSVVTFYLNGLGVTAPAISLRFPESGTVLGVEQDPASPPGVWRMRVEVPRNAVSGSIVPLIDGTTALREPFLTMWVNR